MFCALSQNNQGKKTYESYSKLFKELKNRIGTLVGLDQAVFKLKITTVKMLFGSITQEPLGLP